MMVEDVSQINPERFKSFVKHICIVSKKHKDREDARTDLSHQIDAVRDAFTSNGNIDREIAMLHQKIEAVLAKEAKLLGTQESNDRVAQGIVEKIKDCRCQLDEINAMLGTMKGGIRGLAAPWEKHLGAKPSNLSGQPIIPSPVNIRIQRHLAVLEEKYLRLKGSNKIKNGFPIKGRIESLKQRLASVA